jgi:hypothetical protein
VSYKRDRCEDGPPPKACVVSFHGRPKPGDITHGWVANLATDTDTPNRVRKMHSG